MSLGAFQSPELVTAGQTVDAAETAAAGRRQSVASLKVCRWNQETFAREQIWGLVRQVFFGSLARPVRQIVLTAVESGTDVASICRQIGEALALETPKGVAVVGRGMHNCGMGADWEKAYLGTEGTSTPLLQFATQLRSNLWILPQGRLFGGDELLPSLSLNGHLSKLRREFEYSIVEGPPTGASSEAVALGRSVDGVILVLEAHRTRRAAARKIKRNFEAADIQVLGTVLTGRRFPIPEGIYRRL
jgi:hypothetical protein